MRMRVSRIWARFAADQAGVVATEYLILLGLLSTAVMAAVLLIGVDLAAVWTSWATWFSPEAANVSAPG